MVLFVTKLDAATGVPEALNPHCVTVLPYKSDDGSFNKSTGVPATGEGVTLGVVGVQVIGSARQNWAGATPPIQQAPFQVPVALPLEQVSPVLHEGVGEAAVQVIGGATHTALGPFPEQQVPVFPSQAPDNVPFVQLSPSLHTEGDGDGQASEMSVPHANDAG
jgi:hypothetical protein